MIRLTELKGSRNIKKRTLELPDSQQEALRRLIDAVCCRDGIEENSGNLSCRATRDEAWCRLMGPGIEDYLRLGHEPIKITPEHAAIMRKAAETLKANENLFKKGGKKREISMSEFMDILNELRSLDDLWHLCSDEIHISGHKLDRNEIVELVAWLKTCRGGFVLNG